MLRFILLMITGWVSLHGILFPFFNTGLEVTDGETRISQSSFITTLKLLTDVALGFTVLFGFLTWCTDPGVIRKEST